MPAESSKRGKPWYFSLHRHRASRMLRSFKKVSFNIESALTGVLLEISLYKVFCAQQDINKSPLWRRYLCSHSWLSRGRKSIFFLLEEKKAPESFVGLIEQKIQKSAGISLGFQNYYMAVSFPFPFHFYLLDLIFMCLEVWMQVIKHLTDNH